MLFATFVAVDQFQEVTGVRYPALYKDFLAALDLFNLNVGFILSFACIVRTNYYDQLLYATLGPMVVLAMLGGIYWFAKRRNNHSLAAQRLVKNKHLSIALFLLFLVYSSVSHTIFQTFVCEKLDDGVTYLKADYSLVCTTPTHRAFMIYAAVMVVVYPVGIPAIFSWHLFRNRDILSNRSAESKELEELGAFKDLWEPYKPKMFYFEIIEYTRRVALTGLSVFIYPGSSAQVAIVLLIAASFAMISGVLSPFHRAVDAWLYRAGICVVFLSMYLALLLKVDVSEEDSHSQIVFACLLIAAHVGLILAVVAQSVVWVVEHRAIRIAEQKLPRPRFSSSTPPFASASRRQLYDGKKIRCHPLII